MTTRWRFVLYGLLGIFLAAAASGADETRRGEPDSRPFPCDRLLDGCATATPGERWDRVTHWDFELTSHPRQPKGYFEFYAFPSDKNEDGRAITLDDRGSARMVLFRGEDRLPAKLVVNDQWMVVNASGAWERRSTEKPWSIAFDQKHLYDYSDPTGVPADRQGSIKYSLGPYLSAVMGAETPATSWNNSTRTLTAVKSNTTRVQLRFRTPQDQRRFGTILSEMAIRSSNGSVVSHRCFIVDRKSPLRLKVTDIDELCEALDAEDATDRPGPAFITLNSAPERLAALKLQSNLSALNCVDDRPTRSPEARSRFQEALVVGMDDAMQRFHLVKQAAWQVENPEAFVNMLVRELEVACSSVQAAITQGSADPLIDDACILWLGFEQAMLPHWADYFLRYAVGGILSTDQVSLHDKVKLCMAIGELGAPPVGATASFPAYNGSRFCAAILHARWNWVPTEDELTLCFSKLENEPANPLEREAAIDSLIRWGRLEAIPDEQMNAWFETKLAASRTHRHCTWKALTRTESGRRFLRARLEPLAPQIQREIADIFCHRARATIDMKRFDFMTEAECHETLRVCEPLSEGAESNAK